MEFWKRLACVIYRKWKQDGQGSCVQSCGRAAATRHGLLGWWAPQREGASKGDGQQTYDAKGAHVLQPTTFPLTQVGGSALPPAPTRMPVPITSPKQHLIPKMWIFLYD